MGSKVRGFYGTFVMISCQKSGVGVREAKQCACPTFISVVCLMNGHKNTFKWILFFVLSPHSSWVGQARLANMVRRHTGPRLAALQGRRTGERAGTGSQGIQGREGVATGGGGPPPPRRGTRRQGLHEAPERFPPLHGRPSRVPLFAGVSSGPGWIEMNQRQFFFWELVWVMVLVSLDYEFEQNWSFSPASCTTNSGMGTFFQSAALRAARVVALQRFAAAALRFTAAALKAGTNYSK